MKTYKIREKLYSAGKLSVRQYELIHELLQKAGVGVPVEVEDGVKAIFAVGAFVGGLMETRSLSRFLVLILTPDGEIWTEEKALSKERIDEVSMIEEDVLGELVTDFFTTRVGFINAMASVFSRLMKPKSTPTTS